MGINNFWILNFCKCYFFFVSAIFLKLNETKNLHGGVDCSDFLFVSAPLPTFEKNKDVLPISLLRHCLYYLGHLWELNKGANQNIGTGIDKVKKRFL